MDIYILRDCGGVERTGPGRVGLKRADSGSVARASVSGAPKANRCPLFGAGEAGIGDEGGLFMSCF